MFKTHLWRSTCIFVLKALKTINFIPNDCCPFIQIAKIFYRFLILHHKRLFYQMMKIVCAWRCSSFLFATPQSHIYIHVYRGLRSTIYKTSIQNWSWLSYISQDNIEGNGILSTKTVYMKPMPFNRDKTPKDGPKSMWDPFLKWNLKHIDPWK